MKKRYRVALIAGIALGLLFLVLQFALGIIVKTAVQGLGPKLAGVPITVAHVKTSLVRGYAEISDLTIGNPPGFKTPRAIHIGQLVVDIKMTSLLSSPRIIERVWVDAPEVTYEKGQGSSNLGKIMDALGGDATNTPAQPETKAPVPKEETKLVISDLRVEGARMRIGTGLGGTTILVPLPPVHLTDLGKDSGGASLKDMLRSIGLAVAGASGNVAGQAQQAIGSAAKNLEKGVGKAVESVSGLFKKK